MDTETALGRMAHAEQIRIAKARYCRLIDTKRWSDLEEVLAPEFCFLDEAKDMRVEGREEFLRWVSERHAASVSVHQCSSPEVSVLDDTTAHAVWAMFDVVRLPGDDGRLTVQRGYGHYHDEFRNGPHGWRLSRLRLTRLWLSIAEERSP